MEPFVVELLADMTEKALEAAIEEIDKLRPGMPNPDIPRDVTEIFLEENPIPPGIWSAFEQVSPSVKSEALEKAEMRFLTEAEIKKVREITRMKESVLRGALIDANGKIYLRCDNENNLIIDGEGMRHEKTGVPYVRKEVDINGIKIEVVVPEFDSVFDTVLSEGAIESGSEMQHLSECIRNLRDELSKNPDLRARFTDEELKMIEESKDGRLKGYTWHHDAEYGRMQLVKTGVHSKTGHTGGMSIWGGGYS